MKPHHVLHPMTNLMCVVLLCSACAGPPGMPRPASNRVEEHYHRGQASAERGDYDQAIAEFSHALILNPHFAEAYGSRGVAYALKGDHDRAIENYDEALALNSNLSLVHYQFAQSWFHKQEYDKAWRAVQCYRQAGGIAEPTFIEKLRQASGRQEDDHYNHGLMEIWCGKGGDLHRAIADFTQALALNPRDASAYMNRGIARSAIGDQDGAIADFTEVLALNPWDAETYYYRGFAWVRKGEEDRAIADFTQALALAPPPQGPYIYGGRAMARLRKGDEDGAIADFTEVLARHPRDADAYYNRGLARRNRGDRDGAMKDWQKAADLYQQQGKTSIYQQVLDAIKQLQGIGSG